MECIEETERKIASTAKASKRIIESQRNQMKRDVNSLTQEEKDAHIACGSSHISQKIRSLLVNAGSISRLTMFNKEWHKEHYCASNLFWGYHDYHKTQHSIDAYWLDEWGQKWGNVGLDTGCIDITADYLQKEVPDQNVRLSRPKEVFVDGKSTAVGLVFEFTLPVGACAGERTILAWWGSLGAANSSDGEWKDVAINDPWTAKDDTFWTALTNIVNKEEYNNIPKEIDEGGSLVSVGDIDDETRITLGTRKCHIHA
eukprot:13150394-Ditylum_brightwellii.AAC.1